MIFLSFYYADKFEGWTSKERTDTASDIIRFHVKFASLYLRSRHGGYTVIGLLVVALLGWIAARLLLTPAYGIPEKVIEEILTAASLIVPLIAACVIGLSARSPFGEEEETASRYLPAVRLYHLGGLLVCGLLMLSLMASTWELDYAEGTLARNLAGLTGLALLTARALSSSLSWMGPIAYGVLAITINVLSEDPPEGEWTRWVWWALQPATDLLPVIVAVTLLIIGLVSVCLTRMRE